MVYVPYARLDVYVSEGGGGGRTLHTPPHKMHYIEPNIYIEYLRATLALEDGVSMWAPHMPSKSGGRKVSFVTHIALFSCDGGMGGTSLVVGSALTVLICLSATFSAWIRDLKWIIWTNTIHSYIIHGWCQSMSWVPIHGFFRGDFGMANF